MDGEWPALTALIASSNALEGLLEIINGSSGVDGWHLNGDVATWGEFEAVEEAEAAQALIPGETS